MNPSPAAIGQIILAERKRQKLSLGELARRSDVSKGMLSHVEQGKANATVALLSRIAVGLQVDIHHLLRRGGSAAGVWRVIRSDDENYVFFQSADCTLRTLSPLDLEKQIEFYELRLGPRGKLTSEPHYPGTEEILTVSKGHLRVDSGGREVELRTGDSAHYAADVPHSIVNLGKRQAVAFMIVRWPH